MRKHLCREDKTTTSNECELTFPQVRELHDPTTVSISCAYEQRDHFSRDLHVSSTIYAANGSPLALAGLWASWADPETGEQLRTCTIITGRPNGLVARLHDRMPVAIPPGLWDRWLDGRQRDPEVIRAVLDEVTSPEMGEHAVSTLVNKVQNNVPELIARLETPAVDA